MEGKPLDLLFIIHICFASCCKIAHQKHCFTSPCSGIFNVQFISKALVGTPAPPSLKMQHNLGEITKQNKTIWISHFWCVQF